VPGPTVTDDELTAAIREVQQRARARAPQGRLGLDGVEAPDLMPLVHARDAAQAKVAAIGTVNPRPPGLLNSAVQSAKHVVARALDWHIREQIEFNRAAMSCVEASLEAMTGLTRSLAGVSVHIAADRAASLAARDACHLELDTQLQELRALCAYQAEALEEFRAQQAGWLDELNVQLQSQADELRQEFSARMEALGIQQLRTAEEHESRLHDRVAAAESHLSQVVVGLEAAHQERLVRQEEVFRELVAAQHRDFAQALERNTRDVQKRLWEDLAKVREEFEGLIHRELRLMRRRENLPLTAPTPAPASSQAASGIDWLHFAERFRGSEDRIRAQQQRYVQRLAGTQGDIVDLGCGRGEFLEALREAGLSGVGIDSNAECVELCRSKRLRAECADLFAFLDAQPDGSLAAVYCAQVIEHLAPADVGRLIQLLSAKMRPGACVIVETPNPECLAIFATYFYADPTHTRPVPASLLRYYLEEAGFGSIEVEHLNPAAEILPALAEFPSAVRDALFGGLDYAISAIRLIS